MCNKTPHKHAAVIKAWADGATVQVKGRYTDQWKTIDDCNTPVWHSELEYRVKPDPKPDVVRYGVATLDNGIYAIVQYLGPSNGRIDNNIKLTFDGETGKLKKAEVIA